MLREKDAVANLAVNGLLGDPHEQAPRDLLTLWIQMARARRVKG
jgi:hypothetical protein